MRRYETLASSELRTGMIVMSHGLLCLIDGPIATYPGNHGPDFPVYRADALVLNREEVSADRVPLSFTAPREVWSPEARRWVRPEGAHRWGLQGNDLAHWAVLVHGPEARS